MSSVEKTREIKPKRQTCKRNQVKKLKKGSGAQSATEKWINREMKPGGTRVRDYLVFGGKRTGVKDSPHQTTK